MGQLKTQEKVKIGSDTAKHSLAKGSFWGRICNHWSLSLPSVPQLCLIQEISLPFDFLPAAGLNSLLHTLFSLQPASAAFHFLPPAVFTPSQVPSTPVSTTSKQQWDREGSQHRDHTHWSSLLKTEKGVTPVKPVFVHLLPQLKEGMNCVLHIALCVATQNIKLNVCLQADTLHQWPPNSGRHEPCWSTAEECRHTCVCHKEMCTPSCAFFPPSCLGSRGESEEHINCMFAYGKDPWMLWFQWAP